MFKNEKRSEIIENIPEYDLKIIQNKKYFKFGVDTVALAKFAAEHNTNNIVVDICSGSGAVGLIYSRLIEDKVANNKGYKEIKHLYFIEKQEYFADLNQRNLELNNFKNFSVINSDIKDKNNKILEKIGENSVNIILCNPPYNITKRAVKSSLDKKAIAKFEEEDFLDALFLLAKKLLKNKGEIFMVHRPERLVDLFSTSRKYSIEPKTMRFVVSNPLVKPSLVLLRFVKNANNFLKIEDPFII